VPCTWSTNTVRPSLVATRSHPTGSSGSMSSGVPGVANCIVCDGQGTRISRCSSVCEGRFTFHRTQSQATNLVERGTRACKHARGRRRWTRNVLQSGTVVAHHSRAWGPHRWKRIDPTRGCAALSRLVTQCPCAAQHGVCQTRQSRSVTSNGHPR